MLVTFNIWIKCKYLKVYLKGEKKDEDRVENPKSAELIQLTRTLNYCLDFEIRERDRWIEMVGGRTAEGDNETCSEYVIYWIVSLIHGRVALL